MSVLEDFHLWFKKSFSGVWPYRIEQLSEDALPDDFGRSKYQLTEPIFRISNSYREVTIKVSADHVFYRAMETAYGAREACCTGTAARGEQGDIGVDNLFSFVIQYLAGFPFAAIKCERKPQVHVSPSLPVIVNNSFSDAFWKSLKSKVLPSDIAVRVTPNWLNLPLRMPGVENLTLDCAAQDPAISMTGIQRAIGFQRVNGAIQYCLFEEREPRYQDGAKVFAGNCDTLEAGVVPRVDIALDLAMAWLNDQSLSQMTPRQIVLRRIKGR